MKRWREVDPGRKALYLAAVLLPLAGLILYGIVCGVFDPAGPPLLFWSLPLCGLLLGLANLVLIWSGHPPRENRLLWDGLLTVSLIPDLGLLGFVAVFYGLFGAVAR